MYFASALALLTLPVASSFFVSPAFLSPRSLPLLAGKIDGMDLSGNDWKPPAAGPQSTDTGDYFPDDYDAEGNAMDFKDQMGGPKKTGPRETEIPGMKAFSEGGEVIGGLEESDEIPEGVVFEADARTEGLFEFMVAGNSKGASFEVEISPWTMAYEDYYTGFAEGSHPSLSVSPRAGRLDRRGGEDTQLTITCEPNGQAGKMAGKLVVVLPDEKEVRRRTRLEQSNE